MLLERDKNGDLRSLDGVYVLTTHTINEGCAYGCVIHNPDRNAVENVEHWQYNWRTDRGIMERICEHGVGHPDSDSARFLDGIGQSYQNIHGCDGCCSRKPGQPLRNGWLKD